MVYRDIIQYFPSNARVTRVKLFAGYQRGQERTQRFFAVIPGKKGRFAVRKKQRGCEYLSISDRPLREKNPFKDLVIPGPIFGTRRVFFFDVSPAFSSGLGAGRVIIVLARE